MNTELLVLKCEDTYVKVGNSAYVLCPMNTASVFPPEQIDKVINHRCAMSELGFNNVVIKKLIISEKDLDEGDIKRS